MKYGILIYKETDNIGDDIQTYAALKYLPKIDYYVDRENLDAFIPEEKEKVGIIMNGWFLHAKYKWPLSPYLHPLFIATHFTRNDPRFNLEYRFLSNYGLSSLKQFEPIGCRDYSTLKLLKGLGVDSYFSGCLTLTIDKFEDVRKQDYICAVDVSDSVTDKIKSQTNSEVRIITHDIEHGVSANLTFEERMDNVRELLKQYQAAKLVVTTRLHCALPCLALGVPVLLIYHDYNEDRIGTYLDYLEHCYEADFVSGSYQYDINHPKKNSTKFRTIKKTLEERCFKYIEEIKSVKIDTVALPDPHFYEQEILNVVKFQRELLIGSYNDLKSAAGLLEKARLETSDEISRLQNEINNLKEQLANVSNKLDSANLTLESIYFSRFYKLSRTYQLAKQNLKLTAKKLMLRNNK